MEYIPVGVLQYEQKVKDPKRKNTRCNFFETPTFVSTVSFPSKDEVKSFLREQHFLRKEGVYTGTEGNRVFHELGPKASFTMNKETEKVLRILLGE